MLRFALAASLLAAAGCYNPTLDRCTVTCVGDEPCPDSLTCLGDGYCHAANDPATCHKVITDAGAEGIDAPIDGQKLVNLEVDLDGAGTGTVTIENDPNFSCSDTAAGTGPAACVAMIAAGEVTLDELTDSGALFAMWGATGAICGGAASCTIDVEDNTTISATFALPATITLDFDPNGNGDGEVDSNPSGLFGITGQGSTLCDNDQGISQCQGTFATGTQLTLQASPDNGNVFGGWESEQVQQPCPDAGDEQCTFTVTGDIEFEVQFDVN